MMDTLEKPREMKKEETLPSINNPETPFYVLKYGEPLKMHGEVVGKIASSFCYVHRDAQIHDLSIDLGRDKNIHSLAVVDANLKLLGIIIRRELFDVLGKPYGRDVMKHKTVERIMQKVISFEWDRNLFSVSDEVGDALSQDTINYYAIVRHNHFYGIFTTKDLLIYLSSITQQDISLARSLQMSLVKEESFIENQAFSSVGASKMAKGVGGDYYAIREYKPGRWLMALCDVSGKGVSASLITTSISGMYSIYDFHKGIGKFIFTLNNYIHESYDSQKYLTGVFVDLEVKNGTLRFYDMGHSFIYVHREEKLFRLKSNAGNIPIGIMPDIHPVMDKFELKPNDLLLLITDGITEQTNSFGEEFGDKRLTDIVKRHSNRSVKEIKDQVLQELHDFRGSQTQHDDMTMIVLRYFGENSPV